MYIYDIKAVASDNNDFYDGAQGKTYLEALVFSPNSKPVVKNINTVSSDDEENNFYDNLPEGTTIIGYLEYVGEKSSWNVGAVNTKQESNLQQIELPTVALEDIVFIPYKMAAGDMPIIIDKSYADKIQYEYEEAGE